MGIRQFFANLFGNSNYLSVSASDICCTIDNIWYTQYALHTIANIYGSALSKCEFKTYLNNVEKKGGNWYRFNKEPNPNQTSCEFMKQLAHQLVFNLEALVVQTKDGNFYVAQSFTKGLYQLQETTFSNVVVDLYEDGTVSPYELTGTFSGENAIYIKLCNKGAEMCMANLNALYKELIDSAKTSGSNKLKYILDIDSTAMVGTGVDYKKEIERVVNEDFKTLVQDKNVIMPMYKGMDLKVLNTSNANAQNSSASAQSVNATFNNIMCNIGRLYNVPQSFMLGTFEENDMDDFLTFGLDPLAKLISDAFNRKFYKKKAILDGTYLMLDTKRIKHFDILTVSDAINKLISSGVYTINELRTFLEEKTIDGYIGDVHWITRNYAVVGDYIQEQTNYAESGKSTTGGGLK